MIVIIDNYDSFTYNLYQYLGAINSDIQVFRNDEITIEELKAMDISHIIISPGPGYPNDSGICKEVIRTLGKCIPLLGVCLGHQAIGEVFGGKVIQAKNMVHGKTSFIEHDNSGLFQEIKSPQQVMRYHSLVIEEASFPKQLLVTAKSEDGEIMALKHKQYPIYGVQFHPESICTEQGKDIVNNFLSL